MALLWAAGILWGAYDVASAAPQGSDANGNNAAAEDGSGGQLTDATGATITADDNQKIEDAINKM